MPVAANVRIAPAATDPTTAAQSDGAAAAEIFGEIISGLAEASVEGALEAPVSVTVEAAGTQPPPHVGEAEVAETVEQLLALASSNSAGARPPAPLGVEPPKSELLVDGAEMQIAPHEDVSGKDVPVPQALAPVLPVISPPAQYRPVTLTADMETQVSSTDQPKPETSTVSDLPQIAPSQPNVIVTQAPADVPKAVTAPAAMIAPKGVSADRIPQARSAPAADQPPAQKPQIASPRTEAVVQLAFSGLEAVVKAMPSQTSTARFGVPAKRSSEIEPAISLSELKLTTAMTLPSINPAAAAFEPDRAADVAQIETQSAPQPLDAAELVIEHQLDMAHEGEWLDQLARDITRSAGSDSSPLRFRLNPENLGSLRVEISQDRNGAAVRLTTDTEAARTIIADAQPRLIAEARAQGIRISETHVDLGGQTASGDPRRQNAVFEEAPLRTARSLHEDGEGDGNPTPGRSERYA
ncbi:MAG: flagellar hook-length control protein FliK [Pseudomonadota bacterium]|nr:flagellar hook-length control protein FliK [Pseudomonadota bacterium]